jgi:hypothetical protein
MSVWSVAERTVIGSAEPTSDLFEPSVALDS